MSRPASTLLLVLGFIIAAVTAQSAYLDGAVVCSCRCCYMGDCVVLTNGTFTDKDCSTCTAVECQRRATDISAKRRIARIFDVLQDFDPSSIYGINDVSNIAAAADGMAGASEALPVCEIVAVVENANCKSRNCKVSTNFQPVCYDRNDGLIKSVTWVFVLTLFLGVFLALVKNYIPALQEFNKTHFDY